MLGLSLATTCHSIYHPLCVISLMIMSFKIPDIPKHKRKPPGDGEANNDESPIAVPEPAHVQETGRKGRLPSISAAIDQVDIEAVPKRSVPKPLRPLPPLKVPGTTPATFQGKPLRTYNINNENFVMEIPDNEGRTEFLRKTIGGRVLRYELNIIQEPRKARACGNGPRCKFFLDSPHSQLLTQPSFS